MLSILIPLYNYDCSALIRDLHAQASNAKLSFEIIVFDDASTKMFDFSEVEALPNVRFIHSIQNLGRASARNRLARAAAYESLLFIDCDAALCSDDFIEAYLPYIAQNRVVCGGCCYEDTLSDKSFSLRWTYGRKREMQSAQKKQQESFNAFTTFNFLIAKSLFDTVLFDESIKEYGHEDTLFAMELAKKDVEIKYIDNYLLHKGIEENKVFLEKTRSSVMSLYRLYESAKYPELVRKSRLLNTYTQLCKKPFVWFCVPFLRLLKHPVEIALCQRRPSLKLYDLYKLSILCSCRR